MCNWNTFKSVMCCDLLSNPERDNIVAAPQRQTMAEQKPLVSKPQQIQQRPPQKVVYRQVQQKPVNRKQYRRYSDDDDDDISFFKPIIAGALIYDGIMRNNPAEAMIGGLLV